MINISITLMIKFFRFSYILDLVWHRFGLSYVLDLIQYREIY